MSEDNGHAAMSGNVETDVLPVLREHVGMIIAATDPAAVGGDLELRKSIAGCLAQLAASIDVEINRRHAHQKPDRRIYSACVLSLALDPNCSTAVEILAWELYHRKEYQRVLEIIQNYKKPNGSLMHNGLSTLAKNCEEKLAKWIQNNVSPAAVPLIKEQGLDSPVKVLNGIGSNTALDLSPEPKNELVTISDAIISEQCQSKKQQKIMDCRTVLWPGQPGNPIPSPTLETVAIVKSMLVKVENRIKVVSWNAMASLPNHGVTGEMLDTKVKNLTRVAVKLVQPHVSLFCIQECPGDYIRAKGLKPAKQTLVPGQTMGARLQTVLNRLGTFDYIDVATTGTVGDSEIGESHAIVWDSSLWRCVSHQQLRFQDQRRGVALVVLELKSSNMVPPPRLALLSVHLKSGGKDETKADMDILCRKAVPQAFLKLDGSNCNSGRANDALLVCGDFNLPPSDSKFSLLKDLGFEYIGDPDGNPTNQSDFTVSHDLHVYDGAWLWRRTRASLELDGTPLRRHFGQVVEVADLVDAVDDRACALQALRQACESLKPKSDLGQLVLTDICGDGATDFELGPVGRALIDAFKRRVNRDWSDHKPICLDISLK